MYFMLIQNMMNQGEYFKTKYSLTIDASNKHKGDQFYYIVKNNNNFNNCEFDLEVNVA